MKFKIFKTLLPLIVLFSFLIFINKHNPRMSFRFVRDVFFYDSQQCPRVRSVVNIIITFSNK